MPLQKRNEDRSGTEPKNLYTFVGLAEIRAHYECDDFMVETASGAQIWHRENDAVAREAIDGWLKNEGIAKARALSRAAATPG